MLGSAVEQLYCEEPGCTNPIREKQPERLARRRARWDGMLLCASCAAKRTRKREDLMQVSLENLKKASAVIPGAKKDCQTTGRLAGLEEIRAALPPEHRPRSLVTLYNHISLGAIATTQIGRMHVASPDTVGGYPLWLNNYRAEEQRKRSEGGRRVVARDPTRRMRLTETRLEIDRQDAAAIRDAGYAWSRQTEELLYRSHTIRETVIQPRRFKFGGRVRIGYPARTVYDLSSHPHKRQKLAKALAALNGAESFGGRNPALTEAELALVIDLRLRDPRSWGWRNLVKLVTERRSPSKPAVSHMAVKRAFERATAA